MQKQRERRRFRNERDPEKIVDLTPEGAPSGSPLPPTPAVPPGRDDDERQGPIPGLIPADDGDASSADSSTSGLLPESEGEMWADYPNVVPNDNLPPPEPPPSPAVLLIDHQYRQYRRFRRVLQLFSKRETGSQSHAISPKCLPFGGNGMIRDV